ncbi:CDP-glycerol glycerophosphotransferase family protein [Cryptosporangium sp. NPDC048952]|uniref:CDP-glycerol glycerophosphotransferase family protein n=1 Tax=Cryptosporangium sp. NPDC048952 TaxID=3363961 RepID=UPI003715C24B
MRVVYNSFSGRYSCNPRAVYERLRDVRPDWEHRWLAAPARRADFPPDVETVPFGGAECVAALEDADLVISNDHLALDWQKRPGTRYVQTWHGTPLKRIHHDVRWAPEGRLETLSKDVARWDDLLSPNRASTPRLRRAFGFSGPIHETGYPRNDLLSSPDGDKVRADLRASLGIADSTTAVLYTPTWRDDQVFLAGGRPDFALRLDPATFTDVLGGDHALLLRTHSLVTHRLDPAEHRSLIDVSDYPDIRDLYLAVDVLITDYSSTMFDFAVTGKPLLFYAYDLDDYRDRLRGFYFDLTADPPGPVLRTEEQVLAALAALDAVVTRYQSAYDRFRATFCHADDGHAADRVVELLGVTTPPRPGGSTRSLR